MRALIRIFEEAVYTGAMVARALDACEWSAPLGGLGIPTDLGLAVDGISLGFGKVARHDSVIAIIVALVSRVDGTLNTPLAAAPTVPLGGHSGEQLCQLVLQALRTHPARWNEQVLRARLALIAGDGAIVQGGERSRHSSTNAAKKMFEAIFGFGSDPWVEWDAFHRCDLAYSRAVAQNSSMMEVYDVTACLDNFLSIGDGRTLYRSVCAMLDDPQVALRRAGTRKIGHLTQIAGHLISSYQSISLALHMRLAWKQAGHGTTSLSTLVSVCRRFSDVSFVVFLLLAHDVCMFAKAHVLKVQAKTEPWVSSKADAKLLEDLRQARQALCDIQQDILVSVLCWQHLAGKETAR